MKRRRIDTSVICTLTKIFRERGGGGEGKKRHADEGATMPGGERAALNKGSHEVKRKKKGKEEKKRKKKGEKDGNLSR